MAELYVEAGYVQAGYVQSGLWIDWDAQIIHVPRTYMLLIQSTPTEIRELDLDVFRLELKALEASVEGMPFLDTHRHNAPVTVGGVTLARVVEIINGYTITFEDGQYAVNLVGANSNVADVTNVNQVSVRSANSAGLTYSKQIEDMAFLDGRVWIDVDNGVAGTQYPLGTPANPVNSNIDANDIITNRNLAERYHLVGTLNAISGITYSYEDWLGIAPDVSKIIFSGNVVTDTIFDRIDLSGEMNGNFYAIASRLGIITNFNGSARNTSISNILTLPLNSDGLNIVLYDCYSNVAGTVTPIIDFNGSTNVSLQLRGYSGGIEIRNSTDVNNLISIDMLSGHTIFDSSCTAGTGVVRGTGHVTDNSTGMTIVEHVTPVWSEAEKNSTLLALTSIADATALLQKYQENRSVIDKTAKTLTIYDDDDITPILVFSLLDSLGSPSTDEVAERQPI